MTPARALALLEPVVSALAAAHRAGLIHRDVKPENVLIADEQHGGQVKVADFGLAKAVSADTQHTATGGVLIGTVSYLAPELVVDGRADARADVYAVGRRPLRAAHRVEAPRGRVADPGRLPPRPPRRTPPLARPARHPRLRRRPRRPRDVARQQPAPGGRLGAAAPPPPRGLGPARRPRLRRRAGRRPRPAPRRRPRRRHRRPHRAHLPRVVRRLRAGAADRGRPRVVGALRRRQSRPDDRPRAPPQRRTRGSAATTMPVRVTPAPPCCTPDRPLACPHPRRSRADHRAAPVREGPAVAAARDPAGGRRRCRRLVVRLGALHHDPGRAGPRRELGERRARERGAGAPGGRPGLLRERRRGARDRAPTPSRAARCSTVAR